MKPRKFPEDDNYNAWKDTVDDMLSVCHEAASDDPRESIDRLINWHVQVALDPSVSSDAQALVDKGRKQEYIPVFKVVECNASIKFDVLSSMLLEEGVILYARNSQQST